MLKGILVSMGADLTKLRGPKNPMGVGRILHQGLEVKCQGLMGPNPDLAIDPTVDPEILIQHVIGTLTGVPADGQAPLPQDCVVPTERADEATFTLAPGQEAFTINNPVCCICQQPLQPIA